MSGLYNTLCWLSGGCGGCNGCTVHYAGCLVVVVVVMVVQCIMLVVIEFLSCTCSITLLQVIMVMCNIL